MKSNVTRSYEEFLNPDYLRARLKAASVYIAAFEALKLAIVDRIRGFFVIGFDDSRERIDPRYETDVLARNRSAVHASLEWLKDMEAIDEEDLRAFDRVRVCRNTLAHELLSTLTSVGLPRDYDQCFAEMLSLLSKIDVWWTQQVDVVPCMHKFDGKEVKEGDIVPATALVIQVLCDIAFGDERQSWQHYNAFRNWGAST